jgi:hypothetical protein
MTVPSVMVSDNCGIVISAGMCVLLLRSV